MSEEKVIIFKLTSGEEIIGKYVLTDGEVVQLRSPLRIERMQHDGNTFYTLRAWLIAQFDECEEKIIGILGQHIMAQMMPSPMTLTQYKSTVDYMLSPSVQNPGEADSDEIEWPAAPDGSRLN